MKIEEHLQKADAFEKSATKLDAATDSALYVVFLLRAGTNRVNAALHALHTTTDGKATAEKLGDLNHTYKPRLNVPVPPGNMLHFMPCSLTAQPSGILTEAPAQIAV